MSVRGDVETVADGTTRRSGPVISSRWKWLAAAAVLVAVVLGLGPWIAAEPLRRYAERRINERLHGFSVSLGALHLHLLHASLDVQDLVVVQDAHPDPPVVKIPFVSARVLLVALVRGTVAAHLTAEHPVVYVNRPRLERERHRGRTTHGHGWLRAPRLLVTELTVRDGSFTYIDGKPHRPLTITRIHGVAHDIDTHRVSGGDYPSPTRAEGIAFDHAPVVFDGHADFLRERHPAFRGRLTARNVDLDYFAPSAARHHVALLAGTISGTGELEYAPGIRRLAAETARVDGVRADYQRRKDAHAADDRRRDDAHAADDRGRDGAPSADVRRTGKPRWLMTARTLQVRGANIGFVNEDTQPGYRVFVSDADLDVENFSNRGIDGVVQGRLTGLFMGSGKAVAATTVRPAKEGADLDLRLGIENTDLRTLNDMLRAHAKVDVTSGFFSLHADLHVRHGRVRGSVEPLFRQVRAFSPELDRDKPLAEKFRERLVDVANKILKKGPDGEVTTRIDIDGPLPDPRAPTLETLVYLVDNGLTRAVRRGVEPEKHVPGPASRTRGH